MTERTEQTRRFVNHLSRSQLAKLLRARTKTQVEKVVDQIFVTSRAKTLDFIEDFDDGLVTPRQLRSAAASRLASLRFR